MHTPYPSQVHDGVLLEGQQVVVQVAGVHLDAGAEVGTGDAPRTRLPDRLKQADREVGELEGAAAHHQCLPRTSLDPHQEIVTAGRVWDDGFAFGIHQLHLREPGQSPHQLAHNDRVEEHAGIQVSHQPGQIG
jgi:hypothetical protein